MTHSAVPQIRLLSGKESTPNYRQFSFYSAEVAVLNALEVYFTLHHQTIY